MKIKITTKELKSDFAKEVEERSGIDVKKCYQCGKCTAGCPVAYEMDYMPNQIIRFVQLGLKHEALTSRTIWLMRFLCNVYNEVPQRGKDCRINGCFKGNGA